MDKIVDKYELGSNFFSLEYVNLQKRLPENTVQSMQLRGGMALLRENLIFHRNKGGPGVRIESLTIPISKSTSSVQEVGLLFGRLPNKWGSVCVI